MRELFILGTQILGERAIPRHEGWQPGCAQNIAFYDPKSGEIWGKRLTVDAESSCWLYKPRNKNTFDLTIPLDFMHDENYGGFVDSIPAGVIAIQLLGVYCPH